MPPRTPPLPNLGLLLDSWRVHLEAERKSPETIAKLQSELAIIDAQLQGDL